MCLVSLHAQTLNEYLNNQNIFYGDIIFKEHFSTIENLCAKTGIYNPSIHRTQKAFEKKNISSYYFIFTITNVSYMIHVHVHDHYDV